MLVLDMNKLHSYVDIITNSSTVIYTWSEGSVEKAKDLLKAMFDLFGETEADIEKDFVFKVLTEDETPSYYNLSSYMDENGITSPYEKIDWQGEGYSEYRDNMKAYSDDLFKRYSLGEEVPSWYSGYIEERLGDDEEENDYGFRPDTTLFIFSKDRKYDILIEKMKKFLYSTDHDGIRDG